MASRQDFQRKTTQVKNPVLLTQGISQSLPGDENRLDCSSQLTSEDRGRYEPIPTAGGTGPDAFPASPALPKQDRCDTARSEQLDRSWLWSPLKLCGHQQNENASLSAFASPCCAIRPNSSLL